MALGGEKVTREELHALAAAQGTARARARPAGCTSARRRSAAALGFWKAQGPDALTARQVIGLALGAPRTLGPLPFDGVEASGWLGDLLRS